MRDTEADSEIGVSADVGTSAKRVAVFVDVPNLWVVAKDNGFDFDTKPVIDAAKTYGRVVLAKAYAAIQWGRPVNSGVIDLEHVGFEAVHRCVSPKDGNGKKDIDSLLLTDMIVAAYENVADTFLLASGDSDYVPAIRTIRRLGKKVVVMSYPAQMSPRLLAIADEAISMIPPCEVKDPGNESCAMPPAIRDSTWSRDCGVPVDGSAGVKG